MYKIHCFFHKITKKHKKLNYSTPIDKIRQTIYAIIVSLKGCDNMYSILNKKEIKEFTNKYLPMWGDSIYEVSKTECEGIYEYLINNHYIITVYPDHIEEFDLQ